MHFDPNAKCPLWERFLSEILPSPQLVRYLQRSVGYSLTGDTTEECIFLLFGTGANGKSKFLEVLRHVVGDYCLTTDASTFLAGNGRGIRNDIARLRGARFVTANESEAGKRLAESMLKICTGGDTVTARFLYAEHFEFVPTFKLWFATNHKPRILGNDESIWRRVRLIPFTVTIPSSRRDRKLAEKLQNESSGILNWALDGLRAWKEEGLGSVADVEQATAEYRMEEDVVAHFLAANVSIGAVGEVRVHDFYTAFRSWCEETGESQITQREFANAVAQRGFARRRIGARHNRPAGVYWLGLSLAV